MSLEVAKIRAHVDTIKGNRPVYLLFTHSDYDHIIGYEAFLDATVIASKALVDNPKKEEILQQIKQFDHDYYIERDYAISYPKVDIVIEKDEQIVKIGGTTLRFYLAPGHNSDGIITVIEALNTVIAGDYLCAVEFPFIYHSSIEYLETLDKLEQLINTEDIHLLVAGHGSVYTSKTAMQEELELARKYIQKLTTAIRNQTPFDDSALWERYHFPLLQKQFHFNNIKLIKKENNL